MAEAQKAAAASVVFPPGYYVTWSGQFEHLERAAARLKLADRVEHGHRLRGRAAHRGTEIGGMMWGVGLVGLLVVVVLVLVLAALIKYLFFR